MRGFLKLLRRVMAAAAGALALLDFAAAMAAAEPFVPRVVTDNTALNLGEYLTGELNCMACHPATNPDALLSRPGPVLGTNGMWMTGAFLQSFLLAPQESKPGTTMPDLLHGRSDRIEVAEALAHFLASLYPTNSAPPPLADPVRIEEGKQLYHRSGCVACHGPQEPAAAFAADETEAEVLDVPDDSSVPMSDLAAKTTVPELARFLLDPLHSRPSGRMPSFKLSEAEAAALAMYLLRGQARSLDDSESAPQSLEGRQESDAAVMVDSGRPMVPLGGGWQIDGVKAGEGQEHFKALQCAVCHQGEDLPAHLLLPRKRMEELNLEQGCLAEEPPSKVPDFSLGRQQRAALREFLQRQSWIERRRAPAAEVESIMASFNCYACHSRHGIGGPSPGRRPYFTTHGETGLGDEGRIPPRLDRAGAKLRTEWLEHVLMEGAKVRPYMAARMPAYGGAFATNLAALFQKADTVPDPTEPPDEAASAAAWGRKLAGTEGLSCISCHTFGSHNALGPPAIDLTKMAQRLNYDWFQRYLLDPQKFRPGTRMPAFWPNGMALNQEILDGDAASQIAALWSYLAAGSDAIAPDGVVHGTMEIVARDEAVVYRNFIAGVGPRAIGVAYPQKANLAFDAGAVRLALFWQGPFLDAAGHRTGRGGAFQPPLGHNVLQLPPGPPFAILPAANAPWPAVTGSKGGYEMLGYKLDSEGRPAFLYSFHSIQVEEYSVAVAGELDPKFIRQIKLRTQQPISRIRLQGIEGYAYPSRNMHETMVGEMWFRAAVGTKIERLAPHSFVVDEKLRLHITQTGSARPIIRSAGKQFELLVPVLFIDNQAAIVEEIAW